MEMKQPAVLLKINQAEPVYNTKDSRLSMRVGRDYRPKRRDAVERMKLQVPRASG